MHKDFLGKELKVGDKVVTVQVGYRQLKRGIIKKITAKQVAVDIGNKDWDNSPKLFYTCPSFVVKYDDGNTEN